jgi:hypothetical protein
MLFYKSNGRKPIKYEKVAAIELSTLPTSIPQESAAVGTAA